MLLCNYYKDFFFHTSIDRSISYCVQDVCRACEACVAPFAFEIRFSSPARVIFLALQRRLVGKVLNSADKKELEERRVVYIYFFCVSSFDPLALPFLCSPPAESVSDSRSIRVREMWHPMRRSVGFVVGKKDSIEIPGAGEILH